MCVPGHDLANYTLLDYTAAVLSLKGHDAQNNLKGFVLSETFLKVSDGH